MKKNIFEKLGIDISKADKETRGFFRGFITEYAKNVKKFNTEEVQEYFHMFIAATMLEYHKLYENFDLEVPYRIKSPKSVLDKVLEYLSRQEKSVYDYNEYNEYQGKLREDLTDMFAITMVGYNRPPTFYSNDPEIQELIEEKKRNHALLGEMQKFKLSVKKGEFSGTDTDAYNYYCTKKQYYINCIMIIERLKTMVDPKATKLLARYNKMLDVIKNNVPEKFFYICDNKIQELNEVENLDTEEKLQKAYKEIYDLIDDCDFSEEDNKHLMQKITQEDTKEVNFLKLEEDFTSRIYDKIDLAILTKQIYSVFDKSDLLKKFGVTLNKESAKRKRTESGYVANFVYLETPFGKVEMQIQSKHENNEGNYGYSAHSSMDGKGLQEFDIPELDDEEGLKEFRTCVAFISPQKFFARFDNSEPNRIMTQIFGQFQNYKSVMSQVRKGSKDESRLKKYFAKLYAKRRKYFPNDDKREKIESFIEYDIEEYLNSPEFKKIIGIQKNNQEGR